MSLLFERQDEGAQQHSLSYPQRMLNWLMCHIRQAVASLGEIWRTPISSLMTIMVLGFSLSLPSALYVLAKNGQQVSAHWGSASEISLFVKPQTSRADITALMKSLQLDPRISRVNWLEKDQALEEFQQQSGFGEALQYLDENPLPDVLIITPSQSHLAAAQASALLATLQSNPEIDYGKLDIQWLERLNAVITLIKDTTGALGLLLCVSVVLIIGNTIRLAILNSKSEIEVMKLVGATDAFIQRPFLYTGFWYGVIGSLLSWIVITSLLWWIESAANQLTQLYQQSVQIYGLTLGESLWLMLIAASMGLLGAWFSVNKHIQAIEPA